jgi:hypothetical protein
LIWASSTCCFCFKAANRFSCSTRARPSFASRRSTLCSVTQVRKRTVRLSPQPWAFRITCFALSGLFFGG